MQRWGYVHLWLLGPVLLIFLISGVTKVKGDVVHQEPHPKPPSEFKSNQTEHGHGSSVITGIPVVTFKWHHVETPYVIMLWILVAGVGKLGM